MISGSFNCNLLIQPEDGFTFLLRVSIPAMYAFTNAKGMAEATTILAGFFRWIPSLMYVTAP